MLLMSTALTIAMLVCASAPFSAGWIAPAALVPWLLALRGHCIAVHVAAGLALGTGLGVGMGTWIYRGLANLGGNPVEAALGLLICAVLVIGVPWAALGVAAGYARRLPARVAAVAFALATGLVEWGWSFPQLGLPWGLLGHTQASVSGVAQLAVVIGVPLVSALLAGLNFAIAQWITGYGATRDALPWAGAYLALLLLGVPVASARAAASGPSVELLIIQSQIPVGERWSPIAQVANLALLGRETQAALDAAQTPVDLVLWPETSLTTALEDDAALAAELKQWMARFRVPLLLGGVSQATTKPNYRNTALWVETDGTVLARFDKTRAVPFVEAVPGGAIARAIGGLLTAGITDRFVEEGLEQQPLRGRFSLSVALCFEVIYPRLVAARTTSDTLAIVNLANDSWYGGVVGEQQLAFASFRAIEHRRYLVRVAEGGPSAVLDPLGRIVRELRQGERGALIARVEQGGVQPSEGRAMIALTLAGALAGRLAARLVGGSRA
jgi:apolipoprotein N-acyltransferase